VKSVKSVAFLRFSHQVCLPKSTDKKTPQISRIAQIQKRGTALKQFPSNRLDQISLNFGIQAKPTRPRPGGIR
jgi:hypothetical protein